MYNKYTFEEIRHFPEFWPWRCEPALEKVMSICNYGYYEIDACQVSFTKEELIVLGLADKTDEELGLGEFC